MVGKGRGRGSSRVRGGVGVVLGKGRTRGSGR